MQVSEGGDAHHVVVLNDVVDVLSLVNSPIIQRVTSRRLEQKPDMLLRFPSLSVRVSYRFTIGQSYSSATSYKYYISRLFMFWVLSSSIIT